MGVITNKSAAVTIINFLGIVIAAFGILYIQTKYLSQEEIGTIKTLNAISLIIFPFVLMGFGSAVYRYYHYFVNNEKEKNQFLTFVILLPLFILIIFTIASLMLKGWIDDYFFKDSPYLANIIYLLPGMVFHYVYLNLFESLLTIKTQIILSNFLKSVVSRLYLIGLVILYTTGLINFNTLLIFYITLHILNVIILAIYYFYQNPYKIKFGFNKNKKFKGFSIYSSYVVFGSLSGVIVAQIDTLMIGSITESLGKVGIYTIAFFMGVVIEIPKRPVIQLTIPLISKYLADGENHKVEDLFKKSAINLLILGGIIFILIWGNIDSIFSIIPNGDNYVEGKYVVFFIGLSKLFDLAVGINFEIIQYSKYYKWNIFLTPFLAIIAILTNWYFITEYGIVGTAVATAISIFLYNSVTSIVVYNKLKMNSINFRHLFVGGLITLVLFLGTFITIENPFLNIIGKSFIMVTVFIVVLYFTKMSLEINRIINTAISRVFRR